MAPQVLLGSPIVWQARESARNVRYASGRGSFLNPGIPPANPVKLRIRFLLRPDGCSPPPKSGLSGRSPISRALFHSRPDPCPRTAIDPVSYCPPPESGNGQSQGFQNGTRPVLFVRK